MQVHLNKYSRAHVADDRQISECITSYAYLFMHSSDSTREGEREGNMRHVQSEEMKGDFYEALHVRFTRDFLVTRQHFQEI